MRIPVGWINAPTHPPSPKIKQQNCKANKLEKKVLKVIRIKLWENSV